MKKTFQYIQWICFICIFLNNSSLIFAQRTSQEQNAIDIILNTPIYTNAVTGYKDDASYLYDGYATVAMKSVSYLLNTGWFNSAIPMGSYGHFSIYLESSLSNTPAQEKIFFVDNSKLKYIQLKSDLDGQGENRNIPTIFGDPGLKDALFEVNPDNPDIRQFNIHSDQPTLFPAPVSINYFPSVYLKAQIGVIKGTDLLLKFSPAYNLEQSSLDINSGFLYGFGILHSISQWLFPKQKGDERLRPDIAVQASFTKFTLGTKNRTHNMPSQLTDSNTLVASSVDVPYAKFLDNLMNQTTMFDFSAFTANVIASININFFPPFIALGYSSIAVNQKVEGNYPFILLEQGKNSFLPAKYLVGSVADPVNKTSTYANIMITAGAKVKLKRFGIHVAYHLQDIYNIYEIGLGMEL